MWYNQWIMIPLLKSPLHIFVSSNMMLIEYVGRKSGKRFTLPVNYLQIGDAYYTLSKRERVWWRNMRGEGQASLRIKGKTYSAGAQLYEEPAAVAVALGDYFRQSPRMAKYYEIGLDEHGAPVLADLQQVAGNWIAVVFKVAWGVIFFADPLK